MLIFTKTNEMENLEKKLVVGAKIKLGKEYCESYGFEQDTIIELVEGYFDEDNGLYTYTSKAPSVYNENEEEYDSIYHLFGNKLENFMDCQILTQLPCKPH